MDDAWAGLTRNTRYFLVFVFWISCISRHLFVNYKYCSNSAFILINLFFPSPMDVRVCLCFWNAKYNFRFWQKERNCRRARWKPMMWWNGECVLRAGCWVYVCVCVYRWVHVKNWVRARLLCGYGSIRPARPSFIVAAFFDERPNMASKTKYKNEIN